MHRACSAKTNYNIQETFSAFLKFVFEYYKDQNNNSLYLNPNENNNNDKTKYNQELEALIQKILGNHYLNNLQTNVFERNQKEITKLKDEFTTNITAIQTNHEEIKSEITNINKTKANKSDICVFNFKLNQEIDENKAYFDYFNAINDKLFSTLMECYSVISDNLAHKTRSAKISFLSVVVNSIPVVGKFIGKGIETIHSKCKEFEIKKAANIIKKYFGPEHSIREFVIKKTSQNIALLRKGALDNISTNEEVISWKKDGLLEKLKNYFVYNCDKDMYFNNPQILGCIDALKIINFILISDDENNNDCFERGYSEQDLLKKQNSYEVNSYNEAKGNNSINYQVQKSDIDDLKNDINDKVIDSNAITRQEKIANSIIGKLMRVHEIYFFSEGKNIIKRDNENNLDLENNNIISEINDIDLENEIYIFKNESHKEMVNVPNVVCKCCCLEISLANKK